MMCTSIAHSGWLTATDTSARRGKNRSTTVGSLERPPYGVVGERSLHGTPGGHSDELRLHRRAPCLGQQRWCAFTVSAPCRPLLIFIFISPMGLRAIFPFCNLSMGQVEKGKGKGALSCRENTNGTLVWRCVADGCNLRWFGAV
jgi:hypothetical protein